MLYQLLGTYGLRPVELRHLKVVEGVDGKELWSMYQKSKGGTKGEKQNQEDYIHCFFNAEGKLWIINYN